MRAVILAAVIVAAPTPVVAAPDIDKLAAAYGARPMARGVALSPSGDKIAYATPYQAQGEAAVVADIATGKTSVIFSSADARLRVQYCSWKTEERLVCKVYSIKVVEATRLAFSRVFAVNADGTNPVVLSQRQDSRDLGLIQGGGDVVDFLPDDPASILMSVWMPPRDMKDTNIVYDWGYSVQRVDIGTGRKTQVEKPRKDAMWFGSDNHGQVRLLQAGDQDPDGRMRNWTVFRYRPKGSRDWADFTAKLSFTGRPDVVVDGFDETGDGILIMKKVDGRYALASRAPGNGADTVLFSQPTVDVEGVERIGKYSRPVGAIYAKDYTEVSYFDPVIGRRAVALGKALPESPEVYILDESWDGKRNLVFAGGEKNPGVFYRFDVETRQLGELVKARPDVGAYAHATQRSLSYPAADGTMIPAYLTVPAGASGKDMPVIVMPHGGPSARDVRGFDWLAQYFAQLGYVVFQPNFRGSFGYGDAFFKNNGFKSWRTAIGDINDGARWLIQQGIANPRKVAAFGWSYGGYAVLQGAVVDPQLYRAVVAVAPVTDLGLMVARAKQYENQLIVADEVGSGPHLIEGSPARNAGRIEAPVLLFHGDKDLNVEITQSEAMDSALKSAGKAHQYVVYPGLDHQLEDSSARADMLAKSARWLEAALAK